MLFSQNCGLNGWVVVVDLQKSCPFVCVKRFECKALSFLSSHLQIVGESLSEFIKLSSTLVEWFD